MRKSKERWQKVLFAAALLMACLLVGGIVAGAYESASEMGGAGGAVIGSTVTCPHATTKEEVKALSATRHSVVSVCADCGKTVSTLTRNHEWKKGETSSCTICGSLCTHGEKTIGYVPNGDMTHSVITNCNYCGYRTALNEAENCTMQGGACTVCRYACPHTDTATVGGVTVCNACGNQLEDVWVYFGYGNGQGTSLSVVPGQTWDQLLGRNGVDLGGVVDLIVTPTGPLDVDYAVMMCAVSGPSKNAYLFYNGKRVERGDVVVVGGQYYPGGWDAQYEGVEVDGWSFLYMPGETWADLCKNGGRLDSGFFTLAAAETVDIETKAIGRTTAYEDLSRAKEAGALIDMAARYGKKPTAGEDEGELITLVEVGYEQNAEPAQPAAPGRNAWRSLWRVW